MRLKNGLGRSVSPGSRKDRSSEVSTDIKCIGSLGSSGWLLIVDGSQEVMRSALDSTTDQNLLIINIGHGK